MEKITFKGVGGAQDVDIYIAQEFIKILPKGMGLYGFRNNENIYLIYISNKETLDLRGVAKTGKDAQAIAEAAEGQIQFVLGKESTMIISLSAKETQRRNGIGTYLILVTNWISESYHLRMVELDDDSDRAGKPHNIYIKVGFKETGNDTDLIGNTSKIRSKLPEFMQKYVNVGKFFKSSFGRKYVRRRRTR